MANPKYMTMRDKAVLSRARGSRERFGFALNNRGEMIADGWKACLAALCMSTLRAFQAAGLRRLWLLGWHRRQSPSGNLFQDSVQVVRSALQSMISTQEGISYTE